MIKRIKAYFKKRQKKKELKAYMEWKGIKILSI